MTTKHDFVVISDDWNGLPTSAIHLFRRIARDHRVFWFSTLGRFPKPNLGDARKVLTRSAKWLTCRSRNLPGLSRTTDVALPNVYCEYPFMIPWFKRPIRRLNCASFMRGYRRLAVEHRIHDPIVITTFPYTADFVQAVEGTRIYYCVDEFLEYPGVNQGDWRVMEGELLAAVDGLVVSSSVLARKQTHPCPVLHLPHGVEFDHFQEGERRFGKIPAMEGITRPIAGFFGLLSAWVDLQLIAALARAFPLVSFVLLGSAEVSLAALDGLDNVHIMGPVTYASLPAYARYFDVGLIPFVLNDLTRAVNPLKLMEYLSLGLPVISTRLPELESIDGPIRLCTTTGEFRDALAEVLGSDRARVAESALTVARENTWDSRTEQFAHFLNKVAVAKNRQALIPIT